MPKPFLIDSSKFAQLKTKVAAFAKSIKAQGPLAITIASMSVVAIITTFTLVFSYRQTPLNPEAPSDPSADVSQTGSASSSQSPDNNPEDNPPANQPPAFINLQPTVDAWLKNTSAKVGLMIYDLDNNRVAASYQPNKIFNIASIYKLFFVYDGYRQIESGAVKANSHYTTTSDYRTGNYTYEKCLDLMIRESYNGCADKMRSDKHAFARVEALIDELNLKNTSNGGLSSTAADITELLKLYYKHPDLSDENWQKITDSMLNQPATKIDADTTYDWRQGLPAGFSNQAQVYDKVGWAWNEANKIWDTYADAAIVEFPNQTRHYTIVVLTSNLPGRKPQTISNLGTRIEDAVLNTDNNL